jgi:hypothetical protein
VNRDDDAGRGIRHYDNDLAGCLVLLIAPERSF